MRAIQRSLSRTSSQIVGNRARMYHLLSPAQFKELDLTGVPYKVIDSTWYMPNVGKTGIQEYEKERIPNSIFLDIDKIVDDSTKLPHMLPSLKDFNEQIDELGISRDDHLIIYDKQGIFANCRTAWMFEIFGHDLNKISLLNNYPLYVKEGGEVDTSKVTKLEEDDKPKYESFGLNRSKVIAYDELLKLLDTNEILDYYLLDARSLGRFNGTDPEPRPGLTSGHIPSAINVPFQDLLTGPEKSIPSKEELLKFFEAKGVKDDKPIIVMCGTGVTACVVKTCLDVAGLNKSGHIIYDGSWTEWLQNLPSKYIIKEN